MFFKKFRYQPEGMCIEGTIAARDESTAFPLGPDIQARLTVIINTALVNSLELDHRVVPWDTVRSRAVLVSMLHQQEAGWSRDPGRDLLLWPGHTATVSARPRLQDNQGASSLGECRREAFGGQAKISYTRAGCRNTVMQMIAEKSVNCSLLSLPPSPGTDLPFCGPLEGLALMYILREQVSQELGLDVCNRPARGTWCTRTRRSAAGSRRTCRRSARWSVREGTGTQRSSPPRWRRR
jgi:hypothetical protein